MKAGIADAENICVEIQDVFAKKCAKNSRRNSHQNRKRNAPTFIKRGKAQKHEYQRQRHDLTRRAGRFLFFARLSRPFHAETRRSNLINRFSQRRHSLPGRITFSRLTLNQNRAFSVEASDLRRSCVEFITYQSVERNKLPVRTSYIHKLQHIDFAAKINVGLHDNFIRSAESVVIVNFHSAEIRLQRAVNVRKIYAEHFNFLLVEFVFVTRCSHAERSGNSLKFGASVCRLNNFIGNVGKFGVSMTFQVDKLHCQAADLTETGQSGRICAHNKSFGGNFISYHKDVVNRVGYGFFKIFSFRPRMHTYKQCRRRRFCTA